MGDWPIGGGQTATESVGADTSASVPTTLGTPGGANTYGAYTELIASTSFEASGFWFTAIQTADATTSSLVTIAIGA